MAEWRTVPSLPGFQVSSEGQVRSLDRIVTYSDGRRVRYRGQPKAQSSLNGYLYIGAKGRHWAVHRLVAEAFHGPCPEGATLVRHLDGTRDNNIPANLRWGTKSENGLDSVTHGTHPNAAKTHCRRGHEFTPENTHLTNGGRARHCKQCFKHWVHLNRNKKPSPTCPDCAARFINKEGER